jgi:hypothetical protein
MTPRMKIFRVLVINAIVALAACAAPGESSKDVAARARPPAERCAHFYGSARAASAPSVPTQASVQAEARAAARRGELDPICAFY